MKEMPKISSEKPVDGATSNINQVRIKQSDNCEISLKIVFKAFLMALLVTFSGVFSCSAHAEDVTQEDSGKNSATKSKEIVDPFGRQTPRSTMQGFINSLSQDNETLASNYLALDSSDNSVELVRQMKLALDTGGRINTELQISNNPAGNLTDRLPPNMEKVGTITVDEQVIDLMLVRKTAVHGNEYWQISTETVKAVKNADLSKQSSIIDKYTIKPLKDKAIAGYNFADIMAVIFLAAFCVVVAYLFIGFLYLILKSYYLSVRKKPLPFDAKFILPLALVITSVMLYEVMVFAGVSVTVREPVNRIKDIVGWFALTWLLLRVVDAIFNRAERESYKRNHTERVSILSLLRKLVKSLFLILATIFIFGNLGFDLTTGIAALGVGGLALALGAQKMIENLVGSVVVVADQPVRVGDYCKFGDMEGTVIDIGIRSTRFRTTNRTIVTVPNGDFSSMPIENFTSRDMFHFNHLLYIKRNVDAKTLEEFIKGIHTFIVEHEFTNSEWNQVRIAELRQDCIVIELRCFLYSNDGVIEFYDKQSQLLIDILKEVENYEVEHALPGQEIRIESNDSKTNVLKTNGLESKA